MPTGRLGTGSAFAKASGDSDVRFQLSANALNLSTCRLKSICCCFISGRSGPDTGRLIMLITVSTSARAAIDPTRSIRRQSTRYLSFSVQVTSGCKVSTKTGVITPRPPGKAFRSQRPAKMAKARVSGMEQGHHADDDADAAEAVNCSEHPAPLGEQDDGPEGDRDLNQGRRQRPFFVGV